MTPPPTFSESSTVQAWLVERLVSLGWTHVQGRDLPRQKTDVLVEDWLVEAMTRLNPEIAEEPASVDEVLPLIRMNVMSAATDGLLAANESMTTMLRAAPMSAARPSIGS